MLANLNFVFDAVIKKSELKSEATNEAHRSEPARNFQTDRKPCETTGDHAEPTNSLLIGIYSSRYSIQRLVA